MLRCHFRFNVAALILAFGLFAGECQAKFLTQHSSWSKSVCKHDPNAAASAAVIRQNLDASRRRLAALKTQRRQQAALCPNAHDPLACEKVVRDIDEDIACEEEKIASYEEILDGLEQHR